MKKFLLAFGVILAFAFTITAATSDFNPTHETSISAEKDGDCEKCGKKDCKGCDATAKACTKKGKSCCKKGDAAAAKSCCKKDGSKKACTGKKECTKKAPAAN